MGKRLDKLGDVFTEYAVWPVVFFFYFMVLLGELNIILWLWQSLKMRLIGVWLGF